MARKSQVGRAKGLEARVARPISLEGHNLLHESGVRYCCSCGAPLLAYAQQAPADAPLLSTVSPPEQALRASEAKFRDYAESASDWFWETGPDYKFTMLTENAFGSNAAGRIGAACWDRALDLETEL